MRALSLIGRVPNCRLGWSQFESGRARLILSKKTLPLPLPLIKKNILLIKIDEGVESILKVKF